MSIRPDDKFLDQIQKATEALKRVIDPELLINIVDLGLVYSIDFSKPGIISVCITLSTQHCPLGESIVNGVKNTLQDEFLNRTPMVTLVWEPPWQIEMMTEAGKKELGV